MFVSLKNGLGDLVSALTTWLEQRGVELRLECKVEALRVRSHQPGRWMYDLILGDGSALSSESLILATPAYVSADLLRPLSPIAGGLLDMIPYASTGTVALAYPAERLAARLRRSPAARRLIALGLDGDVLAAAQLDRFHGVPVVDPPSLRIRLP